MGSKKHPLTVPSVSRGPRRSPDHAALLLYYKRLQKAYGPQGWWPAHTHFEVILGAILTQNTAWKNVEKAIGRLKQEGRLTPEGLRRMSVRRLASRIRPAGYFNVKAARIKNFIRFLYESYAGSIRRMLAAPVGTLRDQLLAVNGIGPETADSILLYAAGSPVFVIDAYTRRIFGRHRMISSGIAYHDLQSYFMERLPRRTSLYNEYHALIVRLAKDHCNREPICAGCPLEPFLEGKKPKM